MNMKIVNIESYGLERFRHKLEQNWLQRVACKWLNIEPRTYYQLEGEMVVSKEDAGYLLPNDIFTTDNNGIKFIVTRISESGGIVVFKSVNRNLCQTAIYPLHRACLVARAYVES